MTEQQQRAKSIFVELVGQVPANDWDRRLDEACAGDEELRARVSDLLRAHLQPGSFLDHPAVATADPLPTLDEPLAEHPGTQIGPYKLLQVIGEGGMGVVYMAEQREPVERRVALKIIKPGMDTRQVIARFEAERQALALMDHPHIARVLDAGATGSGRPYFVMELVKGAPITAYCDEHRLTPRQRLELFVPVCQAVQHAHQKGIIHRDLKPSNILVALVDGRPVPKVIDFGVAKATQQRLTEKTMFTAYGQIVGTLEYMSPEQARLDQLDIDTRSDIYSLGVLLYELLTGTTPVDKQRLRSAGWEEMLRMIREDEPPKPSTRLSESKDSLPSVSAQRDTEPAKLTKLVRGELDWIVMKALEKDRARRYETATGLAHDIELYLNDEPVQACPPSAVYRLQKFARRNRVALLVAGLVLFLLILSGSSIGWALRDRQAREQEIAREAEARHARVSEQVELILEEVRRLEQEQKWPEALAAAKRAEALMAAGEASDELKVKVRQDVADLAAVERLEKIRLLRSEIRQPDEIRRRDFDYEGSNLRYAAAFRQHGIDVDAVPAAEAATWLRSRTHVLPALIVALDDWAACRRVVKDEAGAKSLTEIAQTLDADPWRRRVREALRAKNDKGLEELAGSPEISRQSPSTVYMLAAALRKSGRPERASLVCDRALADHPGDFWLHYEAGLDKGESRPRSDNEAVCHATVALALRPKSAAAYNELGAALVNQGKVDEAIACFQKVVELDPKSAKSHSNLGLALTYQGKLDKAIACYQKAIELDPTFAIVHGNLGVALADQGKLDEAIASYRKAIELSPNDAGIHNGLGVVLQKGKKMDDAIASYRKAIELDPNNTLPHHNLADVLNRQGKLAEAIVCYRKAIELDPREPQPYGALGDVLKGQGKHDEAIACYRKATELLENATALNPKENRRSLAVMQRRMGQQFQALGQDENARRFYLECRDCWNWLAAKYSKDDSIQWELIWFLTTCPDAKVQEPARSVELGKKLVERNPHDQFSWRILGAAHLRAGDWNESRVALEKANQLGRGGGAWEWFFLAMAHWQLGNKAEACSWYDRAVAHLEYCQKIQFDVDEIIQFRGEAASLLGVDDELRQFQGHSGAVIAVAISVDGRNVLTGSADKTVRRWDTETGNELNCFQGHTAEVWGVAFSPDGCRAASGGGDGSVRVWNVESGEQLRSLKGHTSKVATVSFLPDGQRILSGSDDLTLRIWDVETGQELGCLKGHTAGVRSVAYSPDGKRAVSGGYDHTVRLWDLEAGTELARFEAHKLVVTSVAFSPDGLRVLSGANDGTLRLWDVADRKELLCCRHPAGVEGVAFSPDGRRALATCQDNAVYWWELENGKQIRRFPGHTVSIHGVAYSRDGRYGLSGGGDGTAHLWNLDPPPAGQE